MLQSYVLRSWLLALAVSATLGVVATNLWGVDLTTPGGGEKGNVASTASQETETSADHDHGYMVPGSPKSFDFVEIERHGTGRTNF